MKYLTILFMLVASAPAWEEEHYRHGPPIAHTPEPATMIMMGTGLAGLAIWARRKRKNPSAK